MSGLLSLKLLLVPSLIVAITLAGRRWGAAVAGCLAGFPVVTGPILFFIAIEQGTQFAANAAVGATLAVLGNIAFGLAYSWVSRGTSWKLSLCAGLSAFFCMVALLNVLVLQPWQAASLTAAGLLLATRGYPDDASDAVDAAPSARRQSDLPWRVLAALALVLAVTIFSRQLGPNLAGLFSVFPVMGGVLAVFSHRNVGQRFTVHLLRGMVQGFFAFTLFCLVLALLLATHGVAVSFTVALGCAILLQSVLMHWHTKKARLLAGGS